MVPIERERAWDAAHDFTRRIAQELAATDPERYVTAAELERRPRQIVHRLLAQRSRHDRYRRVLASRREGFPVAATVTWSAVEKGLGSDAFTMTKRPKQG